MRSRARHRIGLALVIAALVVTVASPAAAPRPTAAEIDREARALEERLVAPCCWRETLSSHRSGIADELRLEIHTRLAAGEPAATIEDDLIGRYGQRLRALPRDWQPRRLVTILWAAGCVALLGLFAWWVRRHLRPAPASAAAAPVGEHDAALEDALVDDLAALDA